MKKTLFSGFLVFIISCSLFAQELALPEIKGYKKVTAYPVFTPDNLWDFINGAADTYLAYGFVDLHVAEYKKGKNVIKLEVYRHSNSTLAFGIYSTERSPSFRYLNIGAQGYSADGSLNFFKGDFYVKIRTYSKSEKTLHDAESLAMQVSDMLKGETSMPAILSQFPDEGKKVNEETYINESVLGHKFLNNAYKATYEAGSDNFSIFIFQKQSSDETLETVNAYMKALKMDTVDENEGKYALNDGYNGTVFLSWKSDKIVLISGLAKDQSELAERYTREIIK
jgi:hypothetical protein